MKKILFIAILLCFDAQAEIKPSGTILETVCGRLNRGTVVCEAITQDLNTSYIVIKRDIGPTDGQIEAEYISALKTEPHDWAMGVKEYSIKALRPRLETMGRYMREVNYELRVKRLVFQENKLKGSIYVNDQQLGNEFDLEHVIHTESIIEKTTE